jgi:hypothetical protein
MLGCPGLTLAGRLLRASATSCLASWPRISGRPSPSVPRFLRTTTPRHRPPAAFAPSWPAPGRPPSTASPSPPGVDPNPGQRLRHRGFEHWPTSRVLGPGWRWRKFVGQCLKPLWRRRGPGRDRLRADPLVRWRALGRARARLGVKAAGGQRCGAVARGALGTLGLGRPESRGPLVRTLVALAGPGTAVRRCPTKAGPGHPSTGSQRAVSPGATGN